MRADYSTIPKTNKLFEQYYNSLELVSADEREAFWEYIRRDLPNSFRFTGSKGLVDGHSLFLLLPLTEIAQTSSTCTRDSQRQVHTADYFHKAQWRSGGSPHLHPLVPRPIGLADDHSQEHCPPFSSIRILPEILGLRDLGRKYQSTRSGQHDPSAAHGHQTWDDCLGHVRGSREQGRPID